MRCNQIIGMAGESPEFLERLANSLKYGSGREMATSGIRPSGM